jgi:hypothetical protein
VPEVREDPPEPMPSREPEQKPAAVSLWHKIFGSPAEQTAKIVDEPVDEPGSPSDLRNEPRSAGSGFSDAHADDQMQMFDETDQGDRSGESVEKVEPHESVMMNRVSRDPSRSLKTNSPMRS